MITDPTAAEGATAVLARYVAGLRYEDVPAEVITRLKLLMLDSIGCALYGARLEWSRILLKQLTAVDDTRRVGIWGTRHRLSAPHAALINGTQVQGFELDDVHRVGVMHVGAVTLPALFGALAGRTGVNGRTFLAAALAGYEVGPRVGICMGQEHIGQGWHSGATLGVFSAAAAAARGIGLDALRTQHALGIAGTQAAGLMAAQYGSMVKRMHAGRSAQSGLYGALLAEGGLTGILDVLEAPYGGFCTTFSRSTDRFDLSALTAGLGESYETMRIALKFYSCVGSNHTTLDAFRDMQADHPFGADDVAQITVFGSQVTVDHVGWAYAPQGLTSAQLNLPFCIATQMLEGDVFVEQFDEAAVTDAARIAFSRKVAVVHDPAITALGAKFRHKVRVEVTLRDGTHLTRMREAPNGSEHSFASEAAIVAKFHKLAQDVLPDTQRQNLVEAILGLEDLSDVGRLADFLQVA
ncbi:MAG: MmgE/PrpD family protein [Cypionkella sp.]